MCLIMLSSSSFIFVKSWTFIIIHYEKNCYNFLKKESIMLSLKSVWKYYLYVNPGDFKQYQDFMNYLNQDKGNFAAFLCLLIN